MTWSIDRGGGMVHFFVSIVEDAGKERQLGIRLHFVNQSAVGNTIFLVCGTLLVRIEYFRGL